MLTIEPTLAAPPPRNGNKPGRSTDRRGRGAALVGPFSVLQVGCSLFQTRGTLEVSRRPTTTGRFVSRALWPGERFKVTVDAEGYGNKAESPETAGDEGGEIDFGRVMLVDASSGK